MWSGVIVMYRRRCLLKYTTDHEIVSTYKVECCLLLKRKNQTNQNKNKQTKTHTEKKPTQNKSPPNQVKMCLTCIMSGNVITFHAFWCKDGRKKKKLNHSTSTIWLFHFVFPSVYMHTFNQVSSHISCSLTTSAHAIWLILLDLEPEATYLVLT